MDMNIHEERLALILNKLDGRDEEKYNYFHGKALLIPSRKEIISLIKDVQELMFPDYFRRDCNEGKSRKDLIEAVFIEMKRQMSAAYAFSTLSAAKEEVSVPFLLL